MRTTSGLMTRVLCVCSEGFSSCAHVFLLCSLYTYDMRYLETPVMVHMDHVSAVLDVDYSPTGKEFVSASFDKTIRIFPKDSDRSRSVTPAYLGCGVENTNLFGCQT